MSFSKEDIYGVSNDDYRLKKTINDVEFDIRLLRDRLHEVIVEYRKVKDPKVERVYEDLIFAINNKIDSRSQKLRELKEEEGSVCK